MNDPVKIAIVVGAALIAVVAIWVYFSPYQSCVRAERERGTERAEYYCGAVTSGRR